MCPPPPTTTPTRLFFQKLYYLLSTDVHHHHHFHFDMSANTCHHMPPFGRVRHHPRCPPPLNNNNNARCIFFLLFFNSTTSNYLQTTLHMQNRSKNHATMWQQCHIASCMATTTHPTTFNPFRRATTLLHAPLCVFDSHHHLTGRNRHEKGPNDGINRRLGPRCVFLKF